MCLSTNLYSIYYKPRLWLSISLYFSMFLQQSLWQPTFYGLFLLFSSTAFLIFFPLPHGQGSFGYTFFSFTIGCWIPIRPILSEFHVYLHSLYTAVPYSVTPAYIFFHHRADFLSLHHKFLLLQLHLFFLSPLSQNILHRSVCHKIPLLQADYFLLSV